MNNLRVDDYLPHRGRMRLIDAITGIAGKSAETASIVKTEWPLVENGFASPIILIELIAQTAGILNNYDQIRRIGNNADRLGWLVGVKKAEFYIEKIPVNTLIATVASNTFSYDRFLESDGTCRTGGQTLAEITLQIIQPNPLRT